MRPGIRDLRSKTDLTEDDLQLVLGEVASAKAEGRAEDLADSLLTLSFVVKWVRSDNDQDPFSRSRTLALEALAIYESIGNKNGIISALLDSLVWQPPEEVDKVLKRALSLAQEIGDELPIAQVYSRMAAHSGMRDRPQAIELNHKAKDIYEKLGQRRGIAFCLNQLVIFYESSDEKAKAGLRAADLFVEDEDFSSAAKSLSMVLGLASNGMTLQERKNLALRLLGYSQKLKGRSKEKHLFLRSLSVSCQFKMMATASLT